MGSAVGTLVGAGLAFATGGTSLIATGAMLGGAAGGLIGGGAGSSPSGAGQQAQQVIDPFAAYRPQYASQLNSFMQNPNVSALPGFQQDLSQGTQALQRQAATTGNTSSGAELMQLQNYAMNLSNQYYNQNIQNLGSLSGATSAQVQVAGGKAGITTANQTAQAQTAGIGSGVSALSNLLSLGGSGGGGGSQPTAQNTNIDPAIMGAAAPNASGGFSNVSAMPGFYGIGG